MTLDKLITSTDWTADKLAKAIGVAEPTISRLRTGTRDASLALALAIELATDGAVTVEELPLSEYSSRWWKKWQKWIGM